MAITPKPGDFLITNTRERILSEDLTMMPSLAKYDLGVSMAQKIPFGGNNIGNGCVIRGMKVSQDSPTGMNVRIASGIFGIYDDIQAGILSSGQFNEKYHAFRLGYSDADEITISPNTSGNPRIDTILVKLTPLDAELKTADIFNETSEEFDSTPNTPKVKRYLSTVANGGIYVVEGTPAVSPEEPDVESNPVSIKLASVYVANGATSITDSDIYDRRVAYEPAHIRCRISSSDGEIAEASHYGSKFPIITRRGGLDFDLDISLVSKPSTGVYRYSITGFRRMKYLIAGIINVDGAIHVSAQIIGAAGFAIVKPTWGTYDVEVYTYDETGTFADRMFDLTVEQLEL